MDTNVCFVFLLAIGLFAQRPSGQPVHKTEVEVDFYELVGKVKLQDGERTLLNCTENCDIVNETACKCVHFDHCLNSTVFNCISTGLHRLNLASSEDQFLLRLTAQFPSLHTKPADPQKWHTPVSPKFFLIYIREQYQQLNAQSG